MSTSLAYRRTFLIIRAVQRAPLDREALQTLVCQTEGEDAYPDRSSERARVKAFEEDLRRAREQFGVTIRYDHALKCYAIEDVEEGGWLDAPDEVLQSLLFLYRTFHEDAPNAAQVREMLNWLVRYLPTARQRQLEQQRLGFDVELRELDQTIHPVVEERVRQAKRDRRELEFLYRSPRRPDHKPVRHRVAPIELTHRGGHWYLTARDLERTDGARTTYPRQRKRFRLSYILPDGLQVRPDKLPLTLPPPRRYRLRYRLHPDLARGEITRHFEQMESVPLEGEWEGWVEVTAETSDEFHAAQTLFRYGDKCQVLEPPGVVEWIRGWLWGMLQYYQPPEE